MRRDFSQRFVGSAAGWLWTLIHPLVLLVSWIFVFQYCLRMKPPAEAGDNYPLYLFCGYLPWLLFQDSVQRSANTLLEHAGLITKTVFPSEILPVTVFLSGLISHVLTTVVAIGLVLGFRHQINPYVVLIPFLTFLMGLFAIGFGWIIASLQVYLRDTSQVVVVALTGWFWVTPIFISEFPKGFAQTVVALNPLAYVVRGYRQCLLGQGAPPLESWLILTVLSVSTFVVGGIIFRTLKRGFADVL